jgi:hypothetical protein
MPRAFIQASKSSAVILRPCWVIWKRWFFGVAIGFAGATVCDAVAADGPRLAQPLATHNTPNDAAKAAMGRRRNCMSATC